MLQEGNTTICYLSTATAKMAARQHCVTKIKTATVTATVRVTMAKVTARTTAMANAMAKALEIRGDESRRKGFVQRKSLTLCNNQFEKETCHLYKKYS